MQKPKVSLNQDTVWVSRVLKYPKSVWRIWQRFSCLLDEETPKIWKKLNSHDGFLSYLQNSTANSAHYHLAAHFSTALVCNKKLPWGFNFFHIFGILLPSRHEKCCQILQKFIWVYQYSRNSVKSALNRPSTEHKKMYNLDFEHKRINIFLPLKLSLWGAKNSRFESEFR